MKLNRHLFYVLTGVSLVACADRDLPGGDGGTQADDNRSTYMSVAIDLKGDPYAPSRAGDEVTAAGNENEYLTVSLGFLSSNLPSELRFTIPNGSPAYPDDTDNLPETGLYSLGNKQMRSVPFEVPLQSFRAAIVLNGWYNGGGPAATTPWLQYPVMNQKVNDNALMGGLTVDMEDKLIGGNNPKWAVLNLLSAIGLSTPNVRYDVATGLTTDDRSAGSNLKGALDKYNDYWGKLGGDENGNVQAGGANGFLMSSAVKTINLTTEAKKNEVAPKTSSTNVFDFEVSRVVAKGIVAFVDTLKENDYFIPTKSGDGVIFACFDDDHSAHAMKYAGVNGARSSYLFPHEHSCIHEVGIDDVPTNYSSATPWNSSPNDYLIRLGYLDKQYADWSTNFYRISEYSNFALVKLTTEKAPDNASISRLPGKYFFENSFGGGYTYANNLKGYNRYAFAKIYTVFIPRKIFELQGNGLAEIDNPVYLENINNIDDPGVTKLATLSGDNNRVTIDEQYTFYYSPEKQHFYRDINAALLDNNNDHTKFFTYKGGRSAYRHLWNRVDSNNDGIVDNADTKRNTVYILKVTGFVQVGMPWDPIDPDDPFLPRAEEDKNKTPNAPGQSPNVDAVQYMRVSSAVEPWTLHDRESTVGGFGW